MRYIPSTTEIEQNMLKEIGISTFNELLNVIPDNLRVKKGLMLPEGVSEIDLISEFNKFINKYC